MGVDQFLKRLVRHYTLDWQLKVEIHAALCYCIYVVSFK